jgi:hypothetical protein
MPTIPAVTGRSFESTARMASELAMSSRTSTLMVFDDVAVQVDPGDSAETAAANHDATVEALRMKFTKLPLLSQRRPERGDVIVTETDDHATKIMKGSGGIVTEVDLNDGIATKTVIRFARRTVDYAEADLPTLRHLL